jgi:hypothetical protein
MNCAHTIFYLFEGRLKKTFQAANPLYNCRNCGLNDLNEEKFIAFNERETFVANITKGDYTMSNLFAGVEFLNMDKTESMPKLVKYRIWMDEFSLLNPPLPTPYVLDYKVQPDYLTNKFIASGFTLLQEMIDYSIILEHLRSPNKIAAVAENQTTTFMNTESSKKAAKKKSNSENTQKKNNGGLPEMSLKRMPSPCTRTYQGAFERNMLPFLINMAFLWPFSNMVRQIVADRESGLRQMLVNIGPNVITQWTAYSIVNLLFQGTLMVIMCAIAKVSKA